MQSACVSVERSEATREADVALALAVAVRRDPDATVVCGRRRRRPASTTSAGRWSTVAGRDLAIARPILGRRRAPAVWKLFARLRRKRSAQGRRSFTAAWVVRTVPIRP